MSYADVKSVARDTAMEVFRENATKLTREAHSIAYSRAEEFTENFLDEMMTTCPEALHQIQEPGVQATILEAQSGYASTGDEDLANLLVELLIGRMKRDARDLTQLALSSAVSVAKDLRSAHFSLLSCNLFLKGVRLPVTSFEELAQGMDEALYPIQDALYTIGPQDLDYLVGRGCLISATGAISIGRYLRMNYPGICTRGFKADEWPESRLLMDTPLAEPHPENSGYYRVPIVTNMDLEVLLESYELEHLRGAAKEALQHNVMGDMEISSLLTSTRPRLTNTFSRWSFLGLEHYVNTATGTAIGHAHLRNVTGEELPPLGSFL
ncbi:LPO_1073/Vpar_1526 family protein [Streptomyces sp. NPDC086077]|uniref:LPO_1073/Vpar_1526 family protein n=1 Tax=Streptomyces sp. NPDC086077 TaxID=3154862 RepID=UPI003424B7CA